MHTVSSYKSTRVVQIYAMATNSIFIWRVVKIEQLTEPLEQTNGVMVFILAVS